MQSTLFHRAAVGLTSLMISGMTFASDWTERSELDLRPGVTQVSQDIQDLHTTVLWIVTVIGLLVFGLIVYSMIRHRRAKNPNPSSFHENVFLEVLWTVIPFVILIAMAVPATRVLVQIDDSAESELTVKVTGYRWKWSYEYLTYEDDNDIGVSFFSNLATPPEQYNNPVLAGGLFPYGTAKELVGKEAPEKDHNYQLEVDNKLIIPSGQKVRFLVTSDDVIHSFWIPDFGGKKDAIPGFVNEMWALVPEGKEGTYYGQCAELCGKNHAFMPIAVEVGRPEEPGRRAPTQPHSHVPLRDVNGLSAIINPIRYTVPAGQPLVVVKCPGATIDAGPCQRCMSEDKVLGSQLLCELLGTGDALSEERDLKPDGRLSIDLRGL